MKNTFESAATAGAVLALVSMNASAADADTVRNTVSRIKEAKAAARVEAWQTAANCGAPALKPLAELLNDPDVEAARAARRALRQIVHHAGRPGAAAEAKAASAELAALLPAGTAVVRREALWLLSEIAGDAEVPAMAALLTSEEVREDARCALERLPGNKSLKALQLGHQSAPEDYKSSLAHSLRVRGVKVAGYPSQKLAPKKQTSVSGG